MNKVLLLVLIFFGILLITWWMETDPKDTLIKFDSFKKFYAIAPSRFGLINGGFYLVRDEKRLSGVYFRFSFIDWLKYRKFRWGLRRKESRQKDNENCEILIKTMKEEIKKTEEQASQEFAQVVDTIQSLGERKDSTKSLKDDPQLVEMRPKQYYSSDPKELPKYCNQTFQ